MKTLHASTPHFKQGCIRVKNIKRGQFSVYPQGYGCSNRRRNMIVPARYAPVRYSPEIIRLRNALCIMGIIALLLFVLYMAWPLF